MNFLSAVSLVDVICIVCILVFLFFLYLTNNLEKKIDFMDSELYYTNYLLMSVSLGFLSREEVFKIALMRYRIDAQTEELFENLIKELDSKIPITGEFLTKLDQERVSKVFKRVSESLMESSWRNMPPRFKKKMLRKD